MFKSSEEREEERRQREAERARADAARAEQDRAAEEQRAQAAWLASPAGAASAAKRAGEPFFEVQLEVGGHAGTAGFGRAAGRRTAASSAATLGAIEAQGWHLGHAGYFFMVTGEASTERFLGGEATAVNGVTVGVYLFRNADPATPTAHPAT